MDAMYRRLRNASFLVYYIVFTGGGVVLVEWRVAQAKAAIVYDAAPGSNILERGAIALNGSLHAGMLNLASFIFVVVWILVALLPAFALARSTARGLIGISRTVSDWREARRMAAEARARVRQVERLQTSADAAGRAQAVSAGVGQLIERLGMIDEWLRTFQSETEPHRRHRCLAGMAEVVTAIAKGSADGTYPREALDNVHVRAHLSESIKAIDRAGLRADPAYNRLLLAFNPRKS